MFWWDTKRQTRFSPSLSYEDLLWRTELTEWTGVKDWSRRRAE